MPFTQKALDLAWEATLKGLNARFQDYLREEGWPPEVTRHLRVEYSGEGNPLVNGVGPTYRESLASLDEDYPGPGRR